MPEVLATSVFKVDCRNQRWPQRGLRHLPSKKLGNVQPDYEVRFKIFS
jgi:hypothetical protein